MLRTGIAVVAIVAPVLLAGPAAVASEKKDWADCAAGEKPDSAAICSRLIARGNLSGLDLARAYYNRGNNHRGPDSATRAIADYNKALSIAPRHANSYYNRAIVYRDMGILDEAISDFSSYIALKSDEAETYYQRARLWRLKGAPDRAAIDIDLAAAIDPSSYRITLVKALVRSDRGDFEGALGEVNRIVAANPGSAESYYVRAEVQHRAQRLDAAVADLDKALAIEAGFTAAHTLMGRIWEARGDRERAAASYTRAATQPVTRFDGGWAQKTARERLVALPGGAAPSPRVSTQSTVRALDCRKFVASAGMTVATSCED
jgi:tetratricopeptide (TPR) repeat protein